MNSSGMPNVGGIADGILIAGFHVLGRDHDGTLDKVLRICSQANLKLNKNKSFQKFQYSFLW